MPLIIVRRIILTSTDNEQKQLEICYKLYQERNELNHEIQDDNSYGYDPAGHDGLLTKLAAVAGS
jgi:hypothetical protein